MDTCKDGVQFQRIMFCTSWNSTSRHVLLCGTDASIPLRLSPRLHLTSLSLWLYHCSAERDGVNQIRQGLRELRGPFLFLL